MDESEMICATFDVGGSLVGADEDFEAGTNALRAKMLASRKNLKDATVTEAKDTVEFIRFYTRWGKSLAIPVGGYRLISTVFDGVPAVIKLSQPTAGNYGIQYIREG